RPEHQPERCFPAQGPGQPAHRHVNRGVFPEIVYGRDFGELDLVRGAEDGRGDGPADIGIEAAIAAVLNGGEAGDARIHAAAEIAARLDLLQPTRLGADAYAKRQEKE